VNNPNPGATNRYVARTVPIGALLGGLVGAVWGYFGFAMGAVGAFGGLLVGVLPGLLLGLLAGMVAGLVAWVRGLVGSPGGPVRPSDSADPTAPGFPDRWSQLDSDLLPGDTANRTTAFSERSPWRTPDRRASAG
jgi:hypothetical protein